MSRPEWLTKALLLFISLPNLHFLCALLAATDAQCWWLGGNRHGGSRGARRTAGLSQHAASARSKETPEGWGLLL